MTTRTTTTSVKPRCRRAAFILAGTIAALLAVPRAPAATITFDGGIDGTGITLNTAENWLQDALPITSDEVLFDDSTITLPSMLTTTGSSPIYGNLIWNSNETSVITINTGTSTSNTITLSGGGGSTEAIAAGGAAGDLLVMGTEAIDSTLTIGGNAGAGTGRLNLVLGTSGNFDVVNSGATLNITSVISGAVNLTKTGAGTLTLAGANTFGVTNRFTLTSGTVNINHATALGVVGNSFYIDGGAIDNTSGAAITTSAYKQAWNGDFIFKGTNSLNLGAGTVNLGSTAGVSRTITVQGSTLTVGGIISNGVTADRLIKEGAGTLALNGVNTFSGGLTVRAGAAVGGVAAAFGTGTITLGHSSGSDDARLLGNGASLISIANAITVASGSEGNALTIGSASGANSVTFTGAIDLGHDVVVANANMNFVHLSGVVSEFGGARAMTVNAGSGTIIVSNNNTFTGGVTLNSGRLQVGLLNSTGTGVFTITGGSLDSYSGATAGVLNNSSYLWNGDFSFKGTYQVTLATGAVTLGGNRVVTTTNINGVAVASLLVSGGIGDGGNGYSLTKKGASGLTLNGANTYSGATEVQEGLLNLNGAASSLASTSSVIVTGGTLTVGMNSGVGVANRINPAARLTLGGSGIFSLSAGATGPVNSQSFAGLSVIAGSSQLSSTSAVNAGTFLFTDAGSAAYSRALGGTVRILVGSNTSFANAPSGSSTVGSGSSAILIGAVTGITATATSMTDFVRAASGAVSAPTYGTNLWLPGVNTDATAHFDAIGDTQSLRFNTSARPIVTLTGTSTIQSGGILVGSSGLGGGVITGGSLRAASGRDLWIYTSTGATHPQSLTIESLIADNGTSSLTKTGGGKLILTNTANSYAGGTYLGEGVLSIGGGGALGTGALHFTGNGTLQATAATVDLGVRAITIAAAQTATFDSNGSANTITVSGVVSGEGGLTKTGNGILILTAANTYTGRTHITGGTLKLDFSAAGAPIHNIIDSNSLVYAGGNVATNGGFSQTILIQGKEGTANSQTFGGAYTNGLGNAEASGLYVARGMTHLNLFAGGNGGTLTVNLGTISRGFSTDANDSLDISIGSGVTVTTTNAAGLLGSFATVNGNSWANVVGGTIVPYATYSTNYALVGAVLDVGSGGTLAANPNSLRFNGNAAVTVTPGTGVVRNVTGGGILVTSNVGANLSTIAGGTLTGYGARDIIFHQNNTAGDLQVDASIVDTGLRTMTITKNGAGKLILTAKNTTTGPTYLNEGTLVVTGDAVDSFTRTATSTAANPVLQMSDTGNIFLGQAVTQASALTTAATTWTVVAINPGVSVTLSNNAAVSVTGGTFTFGGGGGLGAGASTHFIAPGATLQIGNGGATGSLFSTQAVANRGALILNRNNDFSFVNLVSGTGSLEKQGAGNVTLTKANTFTGDTRISGGSLILSTVATNLLNSTLDYNDYGGVLSFGTLTAASIGGLKGGQNLTLANTSAAIVTLTVGGNHQDTTYSGALSGGGTLSKTGSGTLTLSGTSSDAGSLAVGGGVVNLTGDYFRTAYVSTYGISMSGGVLNVTGTMGTALVSLGQAGFAGNSTTNFAGTEFISGASSTFRVGDLSSATVNVTAGTLTIGALSAGVILGRNGATARGFLNVTGGSFIITGNPTAVRIGAGFSDTEASGASALSISGTGFFTTGTTAGLFLLGSNLAGNSASTGTVNLDGGILETLRPITGGTVGAAIFNFNGGTFKASGSTAAMNLGTLGTANVRNGGAVIDTNGFDITIAQALRHSTIAGDNAVDGGLTKKGAGILTLSGANSFTGTVTLYAGTLDLSGANTLAGPVAVNAGALIVAGGSTLGGGVTVNAGTVTVNGTNSFAGNVTVNAGAMTINGDNTFSGDVILNTGALTVSGQNAIAGVIDVNAGKLLVSGSIAGATGAAGVSIASGATLATTGATATIKTAANGNFEIGGNLSPGDFGTARTLTLDPGTGGKLTFLSGSTFKFDIGLTTASSDRVSFSSAGDWLSGSGNVTLDLNEIGIGIDYDATYIVFQNANTAGFQFANITGYDDELFSAGVSLSGNDYVLSFSLIPEPGSMGSLLGGLSLLLGLHRFRRRAGGWSQNRMHKPPLAHPASSIVHLH